jgi:tetratricopeptide (TPR) repeat protein
MDTPEMLNLSIKNRLSELRPNKARVSFVLARAAAVGLTIAGAITFSGVCTRVSASQPGESGISGASSQPTSTGIAAAPESVGSSRVLQGKAEAVSIREKNMRAFQASQLYKQGALALDKKNYKLAADLFKRAGDGFDMDGSEKFQAQAKFAEAQSRRLLGQTDKASKLFQAAIDLFNEYDPLSPYLKAALDNVKKLSPALTAQVTRDQARLRMLEVPTRIVTVDRNVVLKGGLSDFGSQKLLAQKATSDVQSDYVNKTVHKAFVRMTCLETAELGSNYQTAENRWYPLLASGRTLAIGASQDFLSPSISVKINERFYNVAVDLPDIGSSKRTVFLLTDGSHIVAIEPNSEDMWSLVGDFKHSEPAFTWKKLSHKKAKRKA